MKHENPLTKQLEESANKYAKDNNSNDSSTMPSNAAEFGGKLMLLFSQAEIQAHIWHLQTTLYSQHMALGQFYEGIQGLKDLILEEFQGIYDVRISGPGESSIKIDFNFGEGKGTDMVKEFKSEINKMYKSPLISNYGTLKNNMDTVEGHAAKTIYLLSLKH